MTTDPLETYETDDPMCELCGNTYQPNEIDRGQCPACEDWHDVADHCY